MHVCARSWQQVQLSPPHFLNCPLASAVLSAAASLCFRKPEEENKARASSCDQRGGRSKALERETSAGGDSWWFKDHFCPLDGSKKSLNNLADLLIINVSLFYKCLMHCQYFIWWLKLPLNDANIAYFNVFWVTDFVLFWLPLLNILNSDIFVHFHHVQLCVLFTSQMSLLGCFIYRFILFIK